MPNGDTWYEGAMAGTAWANMFIYAVPAAVLLAGLWAFGVNPNFWIPLLIVYSIGAVAHMVGYGFQASNAQIKISTDYVVDEFKNTLSQLDRISN